MFINNGGTINQTMNKGGAQATGHRFFDKVIKKCVGYLFGGQHLINLTRGLHNKELFIGKTRLRIFTS